MSYEAWPSLVSDEAQAPCGTPGATLSRGNERERSKRRPTPALRRSRFVDFSTRSGAAGGQAHGAGGGARSRHSFCADGHFGTGVRSSDAARRLQAQHSAAEGASWSAFAPADGAADGSSSFCAAQCPVAGLSGAGHSPPAHLPKKVLAQPGATNLIFCSSNAHLPCLASTSSCSVTAALELRSPRFDSVPKKVPDQRQLYNKRVARYYIAKYLSKPVEHQMDSRTHRVRRGRGWSATKKCEYSSCAFMNTFHFCFAAPSGRPGRSGNGRLG